MIPDQKMVARSTTQNQKTIDRVWFQMWAGFRTREWHPEKRGLQQQKVVNSKNKLRRTKQVYSVGGSALGGKELPGARQLRYQV
jgi:hypothetical protein